MEAMSTYVSHERYIEEVLSVMNCRYTSSSAVSVGLKRSNVIG